MKEAKELQNKKIAEQLRLDLFITRSNLRSQLLAIIFIKPQKN